MLRSREPVLTGRLNVAVNSSAEGIINPPIDRLLEVVDSKYGLVIMASKRARQINAYYAQLGEGLLEYVGPMVETRVQEKPLSIALREISEGMIAVREGDPAEDASADAYPQGQQQADDQFALAQFQEPQFGGAVFDEPPSA